MDIENYKISDSKHTLNFRAGLVVLAELINCLILSEIIDQLMNLLGFTELTKLPIHD